MVLSVIIVNYNSWNYLEDCIKSIILNTTIKDFEILIMDNNSKEDLSDDIIKLDERIKFFKSNLNLGFPKANNLLIEKAKGKYILLLNPDTKIIEENTFEECINFLEENNEYGLIGVKTLDGENKIVKACARKFSKISNMLIGYWYLSSLFSKLPYFNKFSQYYRDYNESKCVDLIHGGFMLVKKEVFVKVGLLDTKLDMYLEDIEFPFRALKYGYKTYYLATKKIIHFTNKSSDQAPKLWIRKLALLTPILFFEMNYSKKYRNYYLLVFILIFLFFYPIYSLFFPFLYFFYPKKKIFYKFKYGFWDFTFMLNYLIKNK